MPSGAGADASSAAELTGGHHANIADDFGPSGADGRRLAI